MGIDENIKNVFDNMTYNEQYNYDNDVLNDNNEANPEFKQHHSAIVLEIPQIAACRP